MRKPVKDLEGLYEVDDKGNVYSLPRLKRTPTTTYLSKERKLKPYNNGYGYMLVDMRKDGKRYFRLVHKLVAEAFIPNPNNLPQINHKDGNKANNCIDNLEWCTCSENQLHAFKHNLKPQGSNHPKSKLSLDDVKYIRQTYRKGKRGYGVYTIAKQFKVSPSAIRQIVTGRTYKARGLTD